MMFKRGDRVSHVDGSGPFVFLMYPRGLDDDGDRMAVVDSDSGISHTFKASDLRPFTVRNPRRLWSGKVKTRWTPRPGLFREDALTIAREVLEGHDWDLASSVASINFYVNRAGANLSLPDRVKLRDALRIVQRKGLSRGEQREVEKPRRMAANDSDSRLLPSGHDDPVDRVARETAHNILFGLPQDPLADTPTSLLDRVDAKESLEFVASEIKDAIHKLLE